jgi:glutamate N-acetyltransferase/amino-acid N-acetyltransferase
VLVASTGVIGVRLPIELIEEAVPRVITQVSDEVDAFARAILTTDTRTKTTTLQVGGATFTGVAKGAAMLAPNMATMLAFIATDATVGVESFQACLARAVELSFNRISIDACESTNDSVFAVATGRGPTVHEEGLLEALTVLCRDLALQMMSDAEGGTKVVRIQVSGARDETHAAELAHSVAASALWRAAAHGADPNWGRVVSALGQQDRTLDLAQLEIAIGPALVFDRGRPTGEVDVARKAMEASSFDLTCAVGSGPGRAEVLSADLSPEYVVENAWGTT